LETAWRKDHGFVVPEGSGVCPMDRPVELPHLHQSVPRFACGGAQTEETCFACPLTFMGGFTRAGARFLLSEQITRVEKIDKKDGNGGEVFAALELRRCGRCCCPCRRLLLCSEDNLEHQGHRDSSSRPNLRFRLLFFLTLFLPGVKVIAHLASGKRVVGDALLYTMGRQGNTDSMDLAKAGLQADGRGLLEVRPCVCVCVFSSLGREPPRYHGSHEKLCVLRFPTPLRVLGGSPSRSRFGAIVFGFLRASHSATAADRQYTGGPRAVCAVC